MPPHKSIKDWADDDKPREKMLSKGRQNLSDSELLAILIGSGTPGISAVDLSKLILNDYNNNLNELGKAEINDFVKKYKGIGTAKAITIVAALELGRRRQHTTPLERIAITSSKDVFNYLYGTMADLPHEEFWILLCNRSNKVMDKIQIGQGGLSSGEAGKCHYPLSQSSFRQPETVQ
ncbi:MAG TPA: JAB domain-containing protein [Saprospiraceae bacterium]|nr:JAB domain-containing protein [Saprospiraceae bacterium]